MRAPRKSDSQGRPYHVRVRATLLEPKHVARIGPALWVYFWLLNARTSADGLVLYHRAPVTDLIARDLGISRRLAQLHLARLVRFGYVKRAVDNLWVTRSMPAPPTKKSSPPNEEIFVGYRDNASNKALAFESASRICKKKNQTLASIGAMRARGSRDFVAPASIHRSDPEPIGALLRRLASDAS